jgi:hypothetical protein
MVGPNASALYRDHCPLDQEESARPSILGVRLDCVSSLVRSARWTEYGKRYFGNVGSRRHNQKSKFGLREYSRLHRRLTNAGYAHFQVGHITMDNADNNDKMIEVLQVLLAERQINFDHRDRRIRCLPHILNICSGHVLDMLIDHSVIDLASSWFLGFLGGGGRSP